MTTIVRVKTKNSAGDMVESHGSASWFGKKQRFEAAQYFVAVNTTERRPILIAKIDGVAPVPESGKDRHELQFTQYAMLDHEEINFIPDAGQNPAVNMELVEILPDLDIDTLHWRTVGKKTRRWSFGDEVRPSEKAKTPRRGLTIAEAKRGLAVGLGVAEDAISISISS